MTTYSSGGGADCEVLALMRLSCARRFKRLAFFTASSHARDISLNEFLRKSLRFEERVTRCETDLVLRTLAS